MSCVCKWYLRVVFCDQNKAVVVYEVTLDVLRIEKIGRYTSSAQDIIQQFNSVWEQRKVRDDTDGKWER